MNGSRVPIAWGTSVVIACCLAGAMPALAAPPTVRLIAASTTDPAIDDVIGVHHVATPDEPVRIGRLLLFFPGTTAPAQAYSLLLERAATQGTHAIGLAYVNEVAVNAVCGGMFFNNCHGEVRREVIFGVDSSSLPEIDVNFDNSIVNRLDRLLAHLETIAPDEGWDAYRDGAGAMQWELVAASGHSQGAGHAAFIARLFRVDRAVLFSGTEPALWTLQNDFVTPPTDFYGFAHLLEPLYGGVQSSWDNIGIPGSPASVDGGGPPFGSQQLFTATGECTGDPQSTGFYHNCHVADDWTPFLADGTPVFQHVWDHLFGVGTPASLPALSRVGMALLVGLILTAALSLRLLHRDALR